MQKKKKPGKKYPAVGKIQKIEWLDHHTIGGTWRDLTNEKLECICHSVGKVVREDDKWITMIQSWNSLDDSVGVVMNIVKACVLSRKTYE